jgi:hypothetical protein
LLQGVGTHYFFDAGSRQMDPMTCPREASILSAKDISSLTECSSEENQISSQQYYPPQRSQATLLQLLPRKPPRFGYDREASIQVQYTAATNGLNEQAKLIRFLAN